MQTSHNVMWYAHCLYCFFLSSRIGNWPGKVSMYFCEHRDSWFNWCSCCRQKSSAYNIHFDNVHVNWHWWTLCNPVIYLMHIICKENRHHKFSQKLNYASDNLICNSFVTVCVVFLRPQQSFKHNLQIPTECVLYLQTFSHLSPISSISFL